RFNVLRATPGALYYLLFGTAIVSGTSSFGSEASEVSTVTFPFVNASGNSANFKTSSNFPVPFGTTFTSSPLILLRAFFNSTGFPSTDVSSTFRVSASAGYAALSLPKSGITQYNLDGAALNSPRISPIKDTLCTGRAV